MASVRTKRFDELDERGLAVIRSFVTPGESDRQWRWDHGRPQDQACRSRVVLALLVLLIVHVGLLAAPSGALPQGDPTTRHLPYECVYVELTHPTYFFAAVCPPLLD
jgi:hypothetical protein